MTKIASRGSCLKVFLPRGARQQDVLKEDDHKLPQKKPQHFIHQRHEGSGRIGEVETHHAKLAQSKTGVNGRLGHIILIHSDLMVSVLLIQSREVLRFADSDVLNIGRHACTLIVILFRGHQSQTKRSEPSDFFKKKAGAPYGLNKAMT